MANTTTDKSVMKRFAFIATFVALTIAPFDGFSIAAAESNKNTVLVVMEGDYKPFQDAFRGFSDACKLSIRETTHDNGIKLELRNSQQQQAVFTIGTAAFNKVKSMNVPLVFSLTNLSSQETVSTMSGVIMNINPGSFYETMNGLIPGISQVGTLYDPRHMQAYIDDAKRVAASRDIELIAIPIRDPAEAVAALNKLKKVELFWMLPDAAIISNEFADYLMHFSIENKIPVVSFSRKYTDLGAVAALSIDAYDVGVQAGEIVNRISAGAPIPIREYARRGRLSINSSAASQLGIAITANVRKRVTDDQ